MNHSRKMILVPEQSLKTYNKLSKNTNTDNPRSSRMESDRDLNKIERILNIVLKLAIIGGYNEDFEIIGRNGNPIENSSIVTLINLALNHENARVGENDFIRLLHDSNVNPNWIINENLRSKLMHYRNSDHNNNNVDDNDDDSDDDDTPPPSPPITPITPVPWPGNTPPPSPPPPPPPTPEPEDEEFVTDNESNQEMETTNPNTTQVKRLIPLSTANRRQNPKDIQRIKRKYVKKTVQKVIGLCDQLKIENHFIKI